jgi:hypothetical protein
MVTGCRRYLLFQRGTRTAVADACLRFTSVKKSAGIAAFSKPGLPADPSPRWSRAASRAFEEHISGRCPPASRSGRVGAKYNSGRAKRRQAHDVVARLAPDVTGNVGLPEPPPPPYNKESCPTLRCRSTFYPRPSSLLSQPSRYPHRYPRTHNTHDEMTSKLAQKAGLKLFEKHIQAYTPVDPLYETYTDDRGKTKRRKVRLLSPA